MPLDISHQVMAQLFWREVCGLVFVVRVINQISAP